MTEPEPPNDMHEPPHPAPLGAAALAPDDSSPPVEVEAPKPRVTVATNTTPRGRGWLAPVIYGGCLVVLIAAGLWIWFNPEVIGGATGASTDQVAVLRQQVQALSQRVAQLEAAPKPAQVAAPSDAELKALSDRIAALEQRPTSPPPAAAAPSVSPEDVAALRAQLAGDEQKFATLDQTMATLGNRLQGSDSQTAAQLQALQGRVDGADKLSSQVSSLTAKAARLTQVQAASAALAAGKPLGTIADAPPALSRFAVAPPPTEAGLRLRFPALSAQALAAAGPDTGDKPFLDRVWGRMQQAVTIRAGERVIVGNPAAAILATAQDALDAGDLAGALAALKRLPADAAAPLAGWIDQANALLAARAALADMAAHA